MTRIWSEGAVIRMETDGENRLLRFLWCGRWHGLQQVVQRWQVDSDWWSSEGRVWRDYVAAITTDGLLFVAYYDHLSAEWRLAKIYD
jgi:hypothetical protein